MLGVFLTDTDIEVLASLAKVISSYSGARLCLGGTGKSHHIAQLVSSTMASLGIYCLPLDTAHIVHGDLGYIGENDLVLFFSKSGETPELIKAIKAIKVAKPNVRCIVLSMGKPAHNYFLLEAPGELNGYSPTLSTAKFVLAGMYLANTLQKVTKEQFAKLHPGGTLGKTLGGGL